MIHWFIYRYIYKSKT